MSEVDYPSHLADCHKSIVLPWHGRQLNGNHIAYVGGGCLAIVQNEVVQVVPLPHELVARDNSIVFQWYTFFIPSSFRFSDTGWAIVAWRLLHNRCILWGDGVPRRSLLVVHLSERGSIFFLDREQEHITPAEEVGWRKLSIRSRIPVHSDFC